MNQSVMFSSKSDDWATPQFLFDDLNREFHFTLDPCASISNAKCPKFFTINDDGLTKSWAGENVFCNPPYGRTIGMWVKKAFIESRNPSTKVVMLLPARTDTTWFHNYIYHIAEVRFIKGRLKFGLSKNSAPFPSMIIVF